MTTRRISAPAQQNTRNSADIHVNASKWQIPDVAALHKTVVVKAKHVAATNVHVVIKD
ncbi:MAG: hypothetical protein JW737_08320 [Acidobacteria bacterium]|nr:hypothetical protein [Acidobacteriota bacterium]